MTVQTQRTLSTKLIVAYKGCIVLVLAIISILSFFSWKNYDRLAILAQDYLVDGEFTLSDWFLNTVLDIAPDGLRKIARVAGIYAIVMGMATIGFWYGKKWANILMLLMVSLPLPTEILNCWHHFSGKHLVILLLNIIVVMLLLKKVLTPAAESVSKLQESI
ncbi:DUF2127 domain-containing protein [Phormidium sp. LEGE 05292]|uniref:DUF2127 domain-containing protein n=1 Tax=[Phormidium] sp. LEGE 05292 TaxID=767427 RepID=UPI0018821F54|nr:DUF2127 domain-containing protein [Phormidium sp. LEGE 05292]MBE9228284.1 DUF2127 domain-containing protein [Phormidium sp. LEGE 05292]